jgi:ABC-2 type transport system ATP-binding protein
LADLLEAHHRLTLRFDQPVTQPPRLAGALSIRGSGMEWTAVCNGALAELEAAAVRLGARVVAEETATLEEIFLAHVGRVGSTPQPTEG